MRPTIPDERGRIDRAPRGPDTLPERWLEPDRRCHGIASFPGPSRPRRILSTCYRFLWTDEIIAHIARHRVSQDEYEHVVCAPRSKGISRSTGSSPASGHR